MRDGNVTILAVVIGQDVKSVIIAITGFIAQQSDKRIDNVVYIHKFETGVFIIDPYR